MDRVGAYNQRSSAYNMCGANEDDVVEPQSQRGEDRRLESTMKYNTKTTTPSRRRPVAGTAVRLMMRRRDDHVEGRPEEWPAQDELAPPTHT